MEISVINLFRIKLFTNEQFIREQFSFFLKKQKVEGGKSFV